MPITDHLYFPSWGASIHTSRGLFPKPIQPFFATIVMTAERTAFELRIDGASSRHQAVAMRPLVKRTLIPHEARIVTVQLDPLHPRFRHFRKLRDPGVLKLEREMFASVDPFIGAACEGLLSIADAAKLIGGIAERTADLLPKPPQVDARVENVIGKIFHSPDMALKQIAAECGVSYDRMSHVFADSVGLPLRSYRLWAKAQHANMRLGLGGSLTEAAHAAGFTDSAHLSRTFRQMYGAPPSYFLDTSQVRRHVHEDWERLRTDAKHSRQSTVRVLTPSDYLQLPTSQTS